MPLPLFLGIGAAIAGATGVGTGVHGAMKMKDAKDTMKIAENRHNKNIEKFEKCSEITNKKMDELGELELKILSGFEDFSNVIEKIQNRPEFKQYDKDGVTLPKYDKEELKNTSIQAGILLGIGSTAIGTAGGFASGVISTGTALSSLSGGAATSATLTAIGGGAISAGGGGMALGTAILGASTLGVGLLVGGVLFNFTGGKLSDKADEAYRQMEEAEKKIQKICEYLDELRIIANQYINSLNEVYKKYMECFEYVSYVVNNLHKTNWDEFSRTEKIATQNTVLLVGLLYKMCQVNLVNKSENEEEMNTINKLEVNKSIDESKQIVASISFC